MSVPFVCLTNSQTGVTTATYKYTAVFTKASTHTAQTRVPFGPVFTRAGVIKSVTATWLEVNAANTALATIDVLKKTQSGAGTGTSILGTLGTLTANATTQTDSTISTAFTPTLNAGSANVNPILTTTAATLLVAAGDSLIVTTTATSTQGTDLVVSVEIDFNLGDSAGASTNLI